MSYEQNKAYLKRFAPEQSPLELHVLAHRSNATNERKRIEGNYIDLGCAAGQTTLALAALYPETAFIGVDFNPAHIANATQEAAGFGLSNVRYIQKDFRQLPSDLPSANLLVVRGIYSWLDANVKHALEQTLDRLAAPHASLLLHYAILPGAVLRDGLAAVLKAAGGSALLPSQGRDVVRLLEEQAPILESRLTGAAAQLAAQRHQSDELWVHDLLNEDFCAEYARSVMQRMQAQGYAFAASTKMARNLPQLLVNPPLLPLVAQWHSPDVQTLVDVVTFNDTRTDLFLRDATPNFAEGTYPPDSRFGVIVPSNDLFTPVPTVNGTLRYENADLRALLERLNQRPRTVAKLAAAFPQLSSTALRDWLDLLWAAGKIAPFLPADHVARIDRDRLRRINRERIGWAIRELSAASRVPLLAAEYGNCLVAGWFECLILANLERRHQPTVHQQILHHMQKAGMAFGDGQGNAAPNQLAALRGALAQLEINYLNKMEYWGIDV